MQHEEHTSNRGRFGNNTNGLGILIVALVAVFLALFCWNFWKDDSKEIEHYRLNSLPTTAHGNDHEEGEKPGHDEAEKAVLPIADSTTKPTADTAHAVEAAGDTSAHTHADSSKH